MNVLLLAPEPFYQERGTPIAVERLLGVLAERGERVDLITYHEGEPVSHPGLTIHRTPALPFVRHIKPGFSWQKVVCDFFMLVKAIRLASKRRYGVVHAVEESVFIALLLKLFFGTPYVYDMDSALGQQIIERHPRLARLGGFFAFWEGLAIRRASAVVPVCKALADLAEKYGAKRIVVLHDPSLLGENDAAPNDVENVRDLVRATGPLGMYVGNLKPYQGIDLLLESFAIVAARAPEAHLAIIGGDEPDIRRYTAMAARLGVAGRVHFLGPRPVQDLGAYLDQADYLVSPRITGNNTPMKLYSYLDSGKAVVATALPTHTQVLDEQVAVLAAPVASEFAEGMLRVVQDGALRQRLGEAGKALVAQNFTYGVFKQRVNDLYTWLQDSYGPRDRPARQHESLPS